VHYDFERDAGNSGPGSNIENTLSVRGEQPDEQKAVQHDVIDNPSRLGGPNEPL
jgi:hypothetical protein